MGPGPESGRDAATPPIEPRPPGLRGFLRGPRLVDRKGFGFVVIIFVLVAVVFAVAFYEFTITLQPLPSAPIQFSAAYMVAGNGTFNVTSVANASWPWQNFTVNLTINNFGTVAVPMAASGHNATLLVGSSTHKDYYNIVWQDRDHDGKVSVGDSFWVTGNGVGLPALSYVQFSLGWNRGAWTAVEYFVTSSAIV
jgi:hypothetical protein